jgi:thiamine-phosphate pyrophosphorylase
VNRLPDARPVLCLVTSRHRLSPGASESQACDRVVAQVGAAARAGVALVQIREPDLSDAALRALMIRVMAAVERTTSRILVNDRVDVALASGADGVHLRADAYSARRLRQLAPRPFLVGRSVHNAGESTEIRDERSADYVLFGTVFPTASKPPGHPVAGLAALSDAVRAASPVPVLAIGGITPANAGAVAGAGAAGVAGIGLFLTTDSTRLAGTVERLQRSFDSSSVFH